MVIIANSLSRMIHQSPGDSQVAQYVLYAQQVLSDVEKAEETRAQVEEERRVLEAQKCESEWADGPSSWELAKYYRELTHDDKATPPQKDTQGGTSDLSIRANPNQSSIV